MKSGIRTQSNIYDDDEKDELPSHLDHGLIKYDPSIREAFEFDAKKDARLLQSNLQDFQQTLGGDKGSLKQALADLLTVRSARQRDAIVREYGGVLDDIEKILKKGAVLTLCGAFLCASIAAYEAKVINKAISDNDLNSIGDIVCTRCNAEITQIVEAYNVMYGKDVIATVNALCEKNKRGSVRIMLDSLFRCKRDEKAAVESASVRFDVDWMLNTKKFKKDDKTRFVNIFCNNNWRYIREINRSYASQSQNNLDAIIDKQFGAGSGYFMKVLLHYSLNPTQYFARKLLELGAKFDKNREEIGRILLLRSEVDLNGIRKQFAKNNGKVLTEFIDEKSKRSKFGYFLNTIIRSIDHYNAEKTKRSHMKRNKKASLSKPKSEDDGEDDDDMKKSPAVSPSPNSTNGSHLLATSVSPPANGKRGSAKLNFADINIQKNILEDSNKREESLQLVASNNNGLITFFREKLKPSVISQLWTKIDVQNKGYIEINAFPDLLALIAVLYKVKMHQHRTKTNEKPAMDAKAVRGHCEHIAMWIAENYVFDQNRNFQLNQSEFTSKFAEWAEEYVMVDGAVMDF